MFLDQLSLDQPRKSRLIAKALPPSHADAVTHVVDGGIIAPADARHPVFSPDDSRVYYSTKAAEPRGGDDGSTAYHGTDLRNHVVSVKVDGTDRRTIYLNEGGEAADTPLWAAVAPELEGVTGKFLGSRKEKESKFREPGPIADLEKACELLATPGAAAPFGNPSAEMAGRALVIKVDTEAHPELAARYQIRAIPNFVVLNAGQLVMQQPGLVDHNHMRAWLEKAAAPQPGSPAP